MGRRGERFGNALTWSLFPASFASQHASQSPAAGGVTEFFYNAAGGGREALITARPMAGKKIRRFLIVMALARLGAGLGLISQPLSPPLSLLFPFFFAVLGGAISLGRQPARMSSRGGGAGGTAIAGQGMRRLEPLFTVFQQTAPQTRPTGANGLQTGRRWIMLRTGHGRCNSRRSSLGREWSSPFRDVFMDGTLS